MRLGFSRSESFEIDASHVQWHDPDLPFKKISIRNSYFFVFTAFLNVQETFDSN